MKVLLRILCLALAIMAYTVYSVPISDTDSGEVPEDAGLNSRNIGSSSTTASLQQTWDTVINRLGVEPITPSGHCRLLINEFNIDNPGLLDHNTFIELLRVCSAGRKGRKRAKMLKGFKLILISGHIPTIYFIADLSEENMSDEDDYRYYVIGTSTVANVNMTMGSGKIQNAYTTNQAANVFPLGDDTPFAIILLYAESPKDLRPIALQKTAEGTSYRPQVILDNVKTIIRKHAQDMVVYARKSATNRCSIFEEIWPEELSPADSILLRDWARPQVVGNDFSLNRCSSVTIPFAPGFFKYGTPTPGVDNDCSGSSYNLEHHMEDVAPRLYSQEGEELMDECVPLAQDSLRYPNIRETELLDAMDAEDARVRTSSLQGQQQSMDTSSDMVEVRRQQELITQIGTAQARVPEHLDTSHFLPIWEKDIAEFQGDKLDLKTVLKPSVKVWFTRCENSKDPLCKYRCRWCVDFFAHGNRADVRKRKHIQTTLGSLKSSISANNKQIESHMKDPVHMAAKKHLTMLAKTRAVEEHTKVKQAYESSDSKYYEATINLFKVVNTEARINTPFHRHPDIVQLVDDMKVNIGTYHRSGKSARLITTFIGTEMHSILLEHLVKNDLPFSLVVDGTTDKHNIPYLIVYINTLENGRPFSYFYRILELKNGESSLEMFNSIMAAFTSDTTTKIDFLGFAKRRLIGLVSDGASNMISPGTSLYARLKTWTGRNLVSVHCMAHRLDLAIKWAVERDNRFKYFNEFNNVLNKLYTYYQSRGSKRFQHLTETAQELGIDLKRLKYWFNVRWSASHYSSVKAVEDDYVALHNDLTAITKDRSFNAKARGKAQELKTMISDKDFVISLKFFKDFLYMFKKLSEDLQSRTGLLLGSNKLISNFRNDIESLKTQQPPALTSFLGSISCPGMCAPPHCTLQHFDKSDTVGYKGLTLETSETPMMLSSIYDSFVDGLLYQIDRYFPAESLQAFNVLLPENFPLPPFSTPFEYGKRNVTKLCEVLGWQTKDRDILIKDLSVLIKAAVSSPDWSSLVNSDPALVRVNLIWNAELPWTPTLKLFINEILSLPHGSALAEMGFSYMSKTLGSNRQNTEPVSMDNILRIKLNGPEKMSEWNVKRYVLKWLEKHERADATKILGGRPRATNPIRKPKLPRSTLF